MRKIYAIVYPAFTTNGDGGFADLASIAVVPFHKFNYEQVCGYSLGRTAEFYDSLEEAKHPFREATAGDLAWLARRRNQNAIIELNVDQDKITGFSSIYTVVGITKLPKPSNQNNNNSFFKPVDTPEWKQESIHTSDLSVNALSEINKQYQNRNEPEPEIGPDNQQVSSCTIV